MDQLLDVLPVLRAGSPAVHTLAQPPPWKPAKCLVGPPASSAACPQVLPGIAATLHAAVRGSASNSVRLAALAGGAGMTGGHACLRAAVQEHLAQQLSGAGVEESAEGTLCADLSALLCVMERWVSA